MRYIREYNKYEEKKKFRRGDYILVTCDDFNFKDELMRISEEPKITHDGFTIEARAEDDIEDYTFFDHEIVKKLTPREAELYKNAKKYNL